MKDLVQCLTQIRHSTQVASFPLLCIGYGSIFFPLVSPFPVLFREMGHGKKSGLSKVRKIQVHVLSSPSDTRGLLFPELDLFSTTQLKPLKNSLCTYLRTLASSYPSPSGSPWGEIFTPNPNPRTKP